MSLQAKKRARVATRARGREVEERGRVAEERAAEERERATGERERVTGERAADERVAVGFGRVTMGLYGGRWGCNG